MTGSSKTALPRLPGWPARDLEAAEACPACRGRRRELLHADVADGIFGAPGRWTLWRCGNCGSAYLDPRPTRDSIGHAYRGYYTHAEAVQPAPLRGLVRIRRGLRNDYLRAKYGYEIEPIQRGGALLSRLLPRVRRHGDRWIRGLSRPDRGASLLDVGCGSGLFVRQMIELGWRAEGVDPDEVAVAAAREKGLPIRVGGLATVAGEGERKYEAVTLTHVIEHFHDPLEELRLAHSVLKPGGMLWIATPSLAAVGHRVFGRDWRGLEPPRHLVVFTAPALQDALEAVGFRAVELHPTQPLARRMFRESAEIGERVEGGSRGAIKRRAARALVPVADVLAGRWPGLGEEIVMTALRPA